MIELGGGVKSPTELREPSLKSPIELQEVTRWRRRRAVPVSGKEEGGARRRGEEEVGGEEHRHTCLHVVLEARIHEVVGVGEVVGDDARSERRSPAQPLI